MGSRESVEDVARVLGRQSSAIVWRTADQADLDDDGRLRRRARRQRADRRLPPLPAAGRPADRPGAPRRAGRCPGGVRRRRRLQHGQLLGARGRHRRHARPVASPAGFEPAADVVARAQVIAKDTGGSVAIGTDPVAAVAGAAGRRHRHLGLDGPRGGGRPPSRAVRAVRRHERRCSATPTRTRSCCTACPPTAARRSPPR